MSSARVVELRGPELVAFRAALAWLEQVDTVRVTLHPEGLSLQLDRGEWTSLYGRVVPEAPR